MARTQDNPETVVSAAMRIEGELKSNGDIKIDGSITGKVHTSQNLFVGPNAQIDADVVAYNAVIAGNIRGNVTVKGSLTILETGKIIGNINCTALAIHEGAFFVGNCKMIESKQNISQDQEPEA